MNKLQEEFFEKLLKSQTFLNNLKTDKALNYNALEQISKDLFSEFFGGSKKDEKVNLKKEATNENINEEVFFNNIQHKKEHVTGTFNKSLFDGQVHKINDTDTIRTYEFPGYTKESITVERLGNTVNIKGELENAKYIKLKLKKTASFNLNENENIDDIELLNGILYILLKTKKVESEKYFVK